VIPPPGRPPRGSRRAVEGEADGEAADDDAPGPAAREGPRGEGQVATGPWGRGPVGTEGQKQTNRLLVPLGFFYRLRNSVEPLTMVGGDIGCPDHGIENKDVSRRRDRCDRRRPSDMVTPPPIGTRESHSTQPNPKPWKGTGVCNARGGGHGSWGGLVDAIDVDVGDLVQARDEDVDQQRRRRGPRVTHGKGEGE